MTSIYTFRPCFAYRACVVLLRHSMAAPNQRSFAGTTTTKKVPTMRPPATTTSRLGVNRAQTATPTFNGRSSPTGSVKQRTPKRKAVSEMDVPGGEETNINVVVRCRGRNDREVRENSGVVVSTNGVKGSQVELSMGPSAVSNKTYQFDKVFSPAADQGMVFDEVVAPILDEVCICAFVLFQRLANTRLGTRRLQLYYLRVRPDRHWQNLHHVWRHLRRSPYTRRSRYCTSSAEQSLQQARR